MITNKYLKFYENKTVLITGHMGFKGSWMSALLTRLGAIVYGLSDHVPTNPNMYYNAGIYKDVKSYIGDVSDIDTVETSISLSKPDIVFHMAAQPIVKESYVNPRVTFNSNVMGTVNVLDACRRNSNIQAVTIITTDKVYENDELGEAFSETDIIGGHDPYSSSKACAEFVTRCYRNCFYNNSNTVVNTVRAGNVIGGGDFAKYRIVPDCYRAMENNEPIHIRNPFANRPYQHVLDALYAYLIITAKSVETGIGDEFNVGPDDCDVKNNDELATTWCNLWGESSSWVSDIQETTQKEMNCLRLNCNKLKSKLDWNPVWNFNETLTNTVEWYKEFYTDKSGSSINLHDFTINQIDEFLTRVGNKYGQ